MEKIFDTYRPEGFGTVSVYLLEEQPEKLIGFLKEAFYAQEINRTINSDNGGLANCILKIGNSCLMISQARDPFRNMRTSFYLFVENVDEMYQRALTHGAQSVFAPADMDYGDRQAGVEDVGGNYWWISKRLEEKGYEEGK